MNTPNENGKPGDNMESPKPQAAGCDSGCGCHAAGKPSNKRWVIGAIVLAAAGVLVARAMIKSDAASAKAPVPAFASLAALPTPKSDGGSATNAGTVPSTTDKRVELIGTLSELNALAGKLDAVFVFLPGKEGTSANPPLLSMQGAARAIESNGGQKCGLFTLKPGSPDYDQIAGKISLPGVLALVKGHGMSAVSGDITEAKLVQGFVAASSAGGCCAPGTPGCK